MPPAGPGEDGTAIVEFVWLALILIVPLVWIVLSVFEVQRGAFAVDAAARSAGRAFALAPDEVAAHRRAEAVVALVLADQGAEGMRGRVQVSCTPFPDHCLTGTSTVTVTVESSVTLPWVPSILGEAAPTFALSSQHSVPIGQYVEASPTAAGTR
ncbi:MAG: hypothetical protein ACI379_01135 [Nocardioides sp.]|uniref:hypothetical protein n=1 Tax=Nocardioides sp. TaxID=35761 RepID=UPI003F03BEB0